MKVRKSNIIIIIALIGISIFFVPKVKSFTNESALEEKIYCSATLYPIL